MRAAALKQSLAAWLLLAGVGLQRGLGELTGECAYARVIIWPRSLRNCSRACSLGALAGRRALDCSAAYTYCCRDDASTQSPGDAVVDSPRLLLYFRVVAARGANRAVAHSDERKLSFSRLLPLTARRALDATGRARS